MIRIIICFYKFASKALKLNTSMKARAILFFCSADGARGSTYRCIIDMLTPNIGQYEATIAEFPIYVNDKNINNFMEEYPLLLFRDVTYFPLTWRFAVEEFGWSYYFDTTNGLVINK